MYYSREVYKVSGDGFMIYCHVPNSSEWFNNEWTVSIVALNLQSIGSVTGNPIMFYTMHNLQGLTGFSHAVNGDAKRADGVTNISGKARTGNREFYLINDISGVTSGTGYTQMEPIAMNREVAWFDGKFSGGYDIQTNDVNLIARADGNGHKITFAAGNNMVITTNTNNNLAYGLFGWVGKGTSSRPATIEHLNIEGINVDYPNNYRSRDIKTGGLCGMADETGIINDIKVANSTVKGISFVGGIVGQCKKPISNCITDRCTIGCGDVYVSQPSTSVLRWLNTDTNQYTVGGLVGALMNSITGNCKVLSTNVTGGEIKYRSRVTGNPTSDEGYISVGGFIGVLDYPVNINNSFEISGVSVVGHDNVGGILGSNRAGSVTGITFNGYVEGSGEDIGGIVGYNRGGTIERCINNGDIKGTGEFSYRPTINSGGITLYDINGNVGGIVGCNNNQQIKNCKNKHSVYGKCNVGGIVGITYGGRISDCMNESTVTGRYNENSPIEASLGWYVIDAESVTGTGGIAGKIKGGLVERSGNTASVETNFNGGGICGVGSSAMITYSFNSGAINGNSSRANRLGGICGAGGNIKIETSYNTGNISGGCVISGFSFDPSDPIGSIFLLGSRLINFFRTVRDGAANVGIGGMIGFIVDDLYTIGTSDINFKYDRIDITFPVLSIGETRNYIYNSYNSGTMSGGITADYSIPYIGLNSSGVATIKHINIQFSTNNGMIGIVGFTWNEWDITKQVDFRNCYFTNNSFDAARKNFVIEWDNSAHRLTDGSINGGTQRVSQNELKNVLYNWAAQPLGLGGIANDQGGWAFHTVTPKETGLGFKGFGVLWWQLLGENGEELYKRTIFHVYDNKGAPIYHPIRLYIDSSYIDLNGSNPYYLYCNNRRITTDGHIMSLSTTESHTAKATNSHYTEEAGTVYNVVVGGENDIYIGKRPVFILAIENNNTNDYRKSI